MSLSLLAKHRSTLNDLLIDWFQFTIFGMSEVEVLSEYFNTKPDECTHTFKGLNGYAETYTIGNKIHIMFHPLRSDMGINIMMSGSACREFEELYDFEKLIKQLAELPAEQLNMNRIDMAIDYYGTDFDVLKVQRKCDKGQFTSRFKSYMVLYESTTKDQERLGEQVTFGKKSSDLHIVFYNKKKERLNQGYEFKKEIDQWVRCELRFRHENADVLFKQMSKDFRGVGKYVKGILRGYLSFKVGTPHYDKENKHKEKECRWWQVFTENVQRLHIEKEALQSSIVKKRRYADMKLSKLISLLYFADNGFFNEILDKGLEKVTSADLDLLNGYLIKNNMQIMTFDELTKRVYEYQEHNKQKISLKVSK